MMCGGKIAAKTVYYKCTQETVPYSDCTIWCADCASEPAKPMKCWAGHAMRADKTGDRNKPDCMTCGEKIAAKTLYYTCVCSSFCGKCASDPAPPVRCNADHIMRADRTGDRHKPTCLMCGEKIAAKTLYYTCDCTSWCEGCGKSAARLQDISQLKLDDGNAVKDGSELADGTRIRHPTRGPGVVRLALGREGKPYGVEFDNGKRRAAHGSFSRLGLCERERGVSAQVVLA